MDLLLNKLKAPALLVWSFQSAQMHLEETMNRRRILLMRNKYPAQDRIKVGDRSVKNIEMTIKENILTITVDLSQRFGKSSSGKSTIIASSEGNQSIPGNEEIKIGLNVYTK